MLIWFELCYLFVTQFLIILEKTNKYKKMYLKQLKVLDYGLGKICFVPRKWYWPVRSTTE